MPRPALLVAAVVLAGCGYVGDPMPPALKMPIAISDLKAWQRGERLMIEFTAPDRTTEGFPLTRFGEIDLRAGPAPDGEFRVDAWAASARRLEVPSGTPGRAHAEAAFAEWIGRQITLGVRTSNPNGRFSEWSNLFTLPVVPSLARPEAVTAEAVPQGVRVRWSAPARAGQTFRILRRTGKQEQPVVMASSSAADWLDTAVEYETAYEYTIQAALKSGGTEAESDYSPVTRIVPHDKFPPATPKELTAVAGQESVELGWERNTESDLAGYRVYRSGPEGAADRLTELVETPAFSDRKIQRGAKYSYCVSALDVRGNESARSQPVEIEVR